MWTGWCQWKGGETLQVKRIIIQNGKSILHNFFRFSLNLEAKQQFPTFARRKSVKNGITSKEWMSQVIPSRRASRSDLYSSKVARWRARNSSNSLNKLRRLSINSLEALDWDNLSFCSNCFWYFFNSFLILLNSFSESSVSGRGRQLKLQNWSRGWRCKIFPWKDQMKYPLSTLCAHQETPVIR